MIESSSAKLTSCYDYDKSKEINRGRTETRIIHVFDATKEIREYLPHINAVVRVKRLRKFKTSIKEEIFYYVSDVKYNAKRFNKGIREHWSIENKLHWVKDVVMLEDKSKISNIYLAPILSLLKSHVIELAYLNSSSVINFQRTIAHNIEQMHLLLE
jgi:predicted transposase YbfD/YdcC